MKNNLQLQLIESVWFKFLTLHLCPRVVFPFEKKISGKLLNLVEKIKEMYVLPKLIDCISITSSFDLWMSKGAHDIFVLVINFLEFN
jgi:hypothetical protein